ncbi:MAG: hypothetical protein ACLGJB_03095 [Blastocatellia bacterium]
MGGLGHISVSDFLGGLGYSDPDEPIRLRFFGPKGAPKDQPRFFAKKYPTTRAEIANDSQTQRDLITLNQTRGLYFVVNKGGDCDASITEVTAFFAEIDDLPIPEQLRRFKAGPLKPSIQVRTRKSIHSYFPLGGECAIEQWREVQERLIAYYGSDVSIKNPSRVMRVPHFDHIHYVKETLELERRHVEILLFDPDSRFTVAQMLQAFPSVEKEKQQECHEQHEQERNKARFWGEFVCNDARAEDRRRSYGERALLTARNIISEAPDGQRFDARRRAGKLIGGYIAGGMITYSEAYAALEDTVRGNTDSFADAIKTLKSAIEHGQTKPISFEEKEAERLAYIGQRRKRAILPPVLKPTSKPQHTVIVEPPKRPTNTTQVPAPTRPAATILLTTEVAR